MESIGLNNIVSFSRKLDGECTILKIINDCLVAGSKSGNIVCWKIESGSEIWSLNLDGPCSDLDNIDEKIFVTESDKVHCIELVSGCVIWSKAVGGVSDYLFVEKDRLWVTSSTYKFEIQDYEGSSVLLFNDTGVLEDRWEIGGKAWFIFVKNKTAFVGLSGPKGYAELKVGFSPKYIELENEGPVISGDYSKIDEICLGHSNGGITLFERSIMKSYFFDKPIKSVLSDRGWVASFETGEIYSEREVGNWQIDVSGPIDFIIFGPSLNGNIAIWSCIWKDFALLKIINEKTGLIDLQIKHDKRIVKIYALDEIIALGDNEGKIMILETEVIRSRIFNYKEDENDAEKRALLRSKIEKLIRD